MNSRDMGGREMKTASLSSLLSTFAVERRQEMRHCTHRRYGNRYKTQHMKASDVPTPEELIQKP
jgi:hypothetical protein